MAQTQYDSDQELERLYASITGRAPFTYRPGSDPLYRSYADRYIQNGRMAMRDTVGQGAALTGGYGSSYAETAGQQQYGEYLRALSEALPELYGKALERYQAEGEALRDDYALAWQRRENAYQRERDALADERYETEQSIAAEQRELKQRDADYQRLYKLIAGTGYQPTDEELALSGLTRAQADALRAEYLRANKLNGSSGGGGSTVYYVKSSSSGSKSTDKTASTSKSKSTGTASSVLDKLLDTVKKTTGGGGGR